MSVIGADATAASLLKAGNAADAAHARFIALAAVGSGVLIASLALVGAKAAEMAGNYESAVTRLYTTAGESKAALGMIGSGVLDMSTQVGTGAQTLIQAMYFVESAGFHGQQGLNVLRIAAMGAKAENSDLTSVVKTLVSTLNAYTGTNLTAAGAMNTMIAAVSQGHMTLNDLAGAVSNVLPATARFHISLIDTTAAIAEMTKQGDNASSAATHLRQMILALEAPSKIGAASMKLVGLSSQQLSDEMKKSLPGAIQMVTDAVGKKFPEGSAAYNQAIKNIAGGSRQMMGFLELSGKHTKDFAEIVRIMSGDVKAGGNSIMGWGAVQGNFNFKMDQAKAASERFMIILGEKLLPVLGNIATAVTPLITKLGDFASTLTSSSPILAILGGILAGLAVVIYAAVVPSVMAAATAFGLLSIAGAPVWIVMLAVIAAITAIILVIQHWGQIMDWITGKTEQMRIAHEQKMVAMRIATDNNTIKMADLSIANLEKMRVGMLKKLQDTHDPIEKRELAHQLKMNQLQITNQEQRLAHAEKDKGDQLKKQIELHNQMLEAQKWFGQRFLDMTIVWTGNVFSAIGTWTHNVLSAIGPWFGSIFSAIGSKAHEILGDIGSFIGGVFSAIGTFVRDRLTWIKNTVGDIFSAIGTKIHDALLGIANFVYQKIQDIENFFKSIPGKIQAALATLGGILVAPFLWLYNHNYYVHDFVEGAKLAFTLLKQIVGQIFSAIGTTIQNFLTWLKNSVGAAFDWVGTHVRAVLTGTKNDVGAIFSAIGTTIQNALTWIKNFVGAIFSAIGTFIRDRLTWIKDQVGSIFSIIGTIVHDKLTGAKNDVGNIFSQMGSVVSSKLNDLKNAVGSIFSTIGSLMHQKLVDAWNGLVSFASGWPSQAFQWGVNLVQGLINGIGSMFSALGNAVSNLAGAITSKLGFHSPPPEGPARDSDTWMPNLIDMLAGGLVAGKSKMKAALDGLISPLATSAQATLHLQATGSLGSLGGNLSTPGLSASYALRSASGGQTIVINVPPNDVYMDGQRLTRAQMPYIVNAIRANAPARF